jgi:hypothetical protein
LIIYDLLGNAVEANSESDDPSTQYIAGNLLDADWIREWVAPYTGKYFVDAGWTQGSYTKTYALSVAEDRATVKGTADKHLAYVFKSEKTGAGINPVSSSYFYTVNPTEAANIRAQATWPWVEKAATFEAAYSNPLDAVPVFRFWSDTFQSHFFTINAAEKAQIMDWSATGKNGYD